MAAVEPRLIDGGVWYPVDYLWNKPHDPNQAFDLNAAIEHLAREQDAGVKGGAGKIGRDLKTQAWIALRGWCARRDQLQQQQGKKKH